MLPIMAGPSTSTTSAWIALGLGLFEPFTYIWQDPRFGISVRPYADNCSALKLHNNKILLLYNLLVVQILTNTGFKFL